MSFQTLYLKKQSDRRLRQGHQWIFSNEVDVTRSPLKMFSAGQQVVVENAEGRFVAYACMSPSNLICARLVSRDKQHPLDKSLLVHRINVALSLRQRCFDQPYYRLVYGDSDFLPGLVIDRFGDVCVVQISNAAMDAMLEDILAALIKVVKPSGVLLKNDSVARADEGLEEDIRVIHGDVAASVPLIENGVSFMAPVWKGQKTGWFYDHRENRARLQQLSKGQRVLDVFSYVGGWGVQAAAAGASEVFCVDRSEQALEWVHENATLNGVEDRVATLQGNAVDAMQQLRDAGERFDIVVVDPPAFIKKRKDSAKGEQAYHRVNQLALRLLNKDGLLVSASCSMHLSRAQLTDVVRAGGRHIDRNIQVFASGGQGADHPVHPAIPETDYLKALFCRVCPV